MDKLDGVPTSALREELDAAESAKAAKRLMIALAYKDGVPVSTLSDRYDVPESTLYYWLDRIADGPISEAVEDDDRPGRPAELDADERDAVFAALEASPADHGFEADEWSPRLVQQFIEREYGVSYSLGHVRRMLRDAEVPV